jgi:predicted RNase H-like nuclease
MINTSNNTWLAGVDGCPAGWIAAFVQPDSDAVRVRIFPRFADILAAPEQPAVIAVDMPIGLPERSPIGGRQAERDVRPLLGNRKSSVFRIPARSAVYAGVADFPADARDRFFHACDIARQTSDDRKALAKQTFCILPKIVEVDQSLRADPAFPARVYETHPEVTFWRLNGEQALDEPKKQKGKCYEPGLALRRTLLMAGGLPRAIVEASPPAGAAADDLLDALACATAALRIHRGLAHSFPDPPPRDAFGLRMAIWA